jgi:peroxiredoxin
MLRKYLIALFCSLFITHAMAAIQYHDSNGKLVPASAMKGKWVVVNYWAAWCRACVVEIPELNYFYRGIHDKNVAIYGVNYDQLPAVSLKDTVNQSEIQFPVLQEDPLNKLAENDIDVLPTTFIVDPEGNVVKKIVGPSTAYALWNHIRVLQKR